MEDRGKERMIDVADEDEDESLGEAKVFQGLSIIKVAGVMLGRTYTTT